MARGREPLGPGSPAFANWLRRGKPGRDDAQRIWDGECARKRALLVWVGERA